jgi:hypothetical protein
VKAFEDYGISERIGYFMADNATSNDTCIDAVLKTLYPHMTATQQKRRRLRCFGHIVNLCAQAFLIGKDADKVSKELDTAYRDGDLTWSSGKSVVLPANSTILSGLSGLVRSVASISARSRVAVISPSLTN